MEVHPLAGKGVEGGRGRSPHLESVRRVRLHVGVQWGGGDDFQDFGKRAVVGMGLRFIVLVRMAVVVIVSMVMVVLIRVGVRVVAMVVRLRDGALGRDDVHLGPRDSPAGHLARLQPRADVQRRRGLLQRIQGNAGIHQRAQEHVAADSGKALQVANSHRD